MRLPDLLRTSVFRRTILFTFGSAVTSLILFAFIYWQTAVYERDRTSTLLAHEASAVAAEPEADLRRAVASRLESDIHRVAFAALFDARGRALSGNLPQMPPDLPADRAVHGVVVNRDDGGVLLRQHILAIALRLPDGDTLVLGRNIEELRNLRSVVTRALLLGVIPALLLALAAGGTVSRRIQLKIGDANQALDRIIRGDLRGRLPVSDANDDIDRLAVGINRMLDEVERMVNQIRGVAVNIAHDVRTPLIQMHTRLERTRTDPNHSPQIDQIVDRALTDLDLTLGTITALLRIAEVEDGRKRRAFTWVDPGAVIRTVFDLYEPLAEEKTLAFTTTVDGAGPLWGDHDLLVDMVSNLVDNAIKFTPAGGTVSVAVLRDARDNVVIRVSDSGPGIAEQERAAVFQRFYRSEHPGPVHGHGLGLSLVRAVAELHGFEVVIEDGRPGAVFTVAMRADTTQSGAP